MDDKYVSLETTIEDLEELAYCNRFLIKSKKQKKNTKELKKLIKKLKSDDCKEVLCSDYLEEE